MPEHTMKNLPNKYKYLFLCALLVLLTFAAYWPLHRSGFVDYDDPEYVTGNPHVREGLSVKGVLWAFTSTNASNWFPLTWLSHMTDCQIYGMNPAGHHLTGLLFHIANALLVFFFFNRTTGGIWQSGFAAAVFAVHPLHVESVAWISERKDVLSAFFGLLAIICYVKYTEWYTVRESRFKAVKGHLTNHHSPITVYAACLAAYAFSLMSKPMLVTLPFVLLLLDIWPLDRFRKTSTFRLVLEKIPMIALSLISCIITMSVQRGAIAVSVMEQPAAMTFQTRDFPLGLRLSNAIVAFIRYIWLMICPKGLCILYPHPRNSLPAWQVTLSLLMLAAITAAVFYMSRRRYLIVGWLWFIVTLIPVIGIVQVGSQAMADRYMYLPSIGILIIAAWGCSDLLAGRPKTKTAAWVPAVLLVAALSLCTRTQTGYWKDSFSLFSRALAVTSGNYIMHNNLGNVFHKEGRLNDAIGQFQQALAIEPDNPEANNNLGNVLSDQGKLDDAARYYRRALKSAEGSSAVYYNLAVTLSSQGRFSQAAEYCRMVLDIEPDNIKARYRLAVAMGAQGLFDEAIKNYRQVLAAEPGNLQAMSNLGGILQLKGDPAGAQEYYLKALRIDSNSAEVNYNLAVTLHSQGQFQKAQDYLRRSLQTSPDNAQAHYYLGLVLGPQGDINGAVRSFRRVLELKPDHLPALNVLARILASYPDTKLRDVNEAIVFAERAVKLTDHKDPAVLDTLAACYAAAGRMEDAVSAANKAIEAALAAKNTALAEQIRRQMELYKAK